ncbi:MAG: TonB-dependent receptor plug domain-containing protein [Terriglobales bacterium]
MKRKLLAVAALLGALGLSVHAQVATAHLSGSVVDGTGRRIAQAQITLTNLQTHTVKNAATGRNGRFSISVLPGVYSIEARKPTFATYQHTLQLTAGARAPLTITLGLAPMQQSLVVTATGIATPQTQLGQSVQTLGSAEIQAQQGLTLAQSLRDLTGVQVSSYGSVGGLTSVSILGADPSFTTILLDGVPVQRFDFGAYDFSTLLPAGLDSVTVVRGGDSVLYGSDAAAGVIDIHTRSGEGVIPPEIVVDTTAGSFDTKQQTTQLLGQWRPVDYAFTFGYLDTHNQVPNDKAWNQTWAGNIGIRLPRHASVRFQLRHISSRTGVPNAYEFFGGLTDDATQQQGETYGSIFLQQQTTTHWHNQVTLSQNALNYFEETITPTGTPFNPFGYGPNYLGNPVTITGANGYSVTGQAVLDYGGLPYPSPFNSDSIGRHIAAETTYALGPLWTLAAGYRFDQDHTVTAPQVAWHNNGVFTELNGGLWNRLFGSAGISEDLQSRFGPSFNPQASLALLPRLGRAGWWDEIRIHANAAAATANPTVTEAQSSVYAIAQQAGALLDVEPIHPQRAHTFEAGLDQYLADDQARVSVTWFDNRFYDLIQFVPYTALPTLGLSSAAAALAEPLGGAYVNALTESYKGMETALEARHGSWHGRIDYTYLVPLVLRSFSSDALSPAENPAFPGIPIGAYSPLVGARPFGVAPESGSVLIGYSHARWTTQTNLTVESRRDDSTFLVDGYLGDTMLLPNHDLEPAFTAWNLGAIYHINPHVAVQGVIENLLNENYQESFGYPSLGRAARLGIRFTFSPPR